MLYKSKKAFTLLEMIFVVVIAGVLSAGTFKALEALYIRSAKAKAVTELSMQSQIVLDQLSVLLYNRIPNSVIGYDKNSVPVCEPIEDITSSKPVLEWLSLDDEQLLMKRYSGFVDMNASSKPNLKTFGITNAPANITNRNLIFAGAFDAGNEDVKACSGAYGFHNPNSTISHGINSIDILNQIIKLNDTPSDTAPNEIYEKYYLTNGAYAVARGEDLIQNNLENNCDNGNYIFPDDANFTTTLFLFYDFYPYNGDTFCGDVNGNRQGKVSILAENVAGFRATYENDIIRLSIDMNKEIRGSDADVHISKQKAVF